MKKHAQTPRKPSIVIGETDHQRLYKLALAAADRLPEISDGLLIELERARDFRRVGAWKCRPDGIDGRV